MAWLEQRGEMFRIGFRFRGEKFRVNLKATEAKEANGCLARLEENLRLVERGRLDVPPGADLGLFLISDGKLEKPVEMVRTRSAQRIVSHLPDRVHRRGEGGHHPGDGRHSHEPRQPHHRRETPARHGDRGHGAEVCGRAKPESSSMAIRSRQRRSGRRSRPSGSSGIGPTVKDTSRPSSRKSSWSSRRKSSRSRFAPTTRFRRFSPAAVSTSGENENFGTGYFSTPQEIDEALEHVRRKARTCYLYPLLVAPPHRGRRSELLRARVEDIDFDAKLVLLREKKRNRDRETFRTVDMTPFLESVMRKYFAEDHPGGVYAFCSKPNVMLTDGQTWKAFLTGMKGSKWHVLRGYHAFRHSFASNLAAAGVDQRVIDELMGHTTVEMQKRYRHLFPDQRRAAVITVFGG